MEHRSSSNGNGVKTWLLSGLLATTVALTGVAWAGHETRLTKIEDAKLGERIATVEVRESSTRELLERVIQQLDRIEMRQLQQAAGRR